MTRAEFQSLEPGHEVIVQTTASAGGSGFRMYRRGRYVRLFKSGAKVVVEIPTKDGQYMQCAFCLGRVFHPEKFKLATVMP